KPRALAFGALVLIVPSFYFQHGQEGFLWNLDVSHLFHTFLALFLLLQQLPLAGDVAAVAFCRDIFAQRFYGCASNHPRADRGLDGHLEHLLRNQFLELDAQIAPALVGTVAMNNGGERIDLVAVDVHVEPDEVTPAVFLELEIERGVAACARFELVVKPEQRLAERQVIADHHAVRTGMMDAGLGTASVLTQFDHVAHVFLRNVDRAGDDRLLEALDVALFGQLARVVDLDDLSPLGDAAVAHGRGGRDQREIVFTLEPLLHDLHVQEAENTAAEPEAEAPRRSP